jgi:uncharacterized protein
MSDREFLVGLISDTHGLLRPEAVSALRGSDLIIHAGDVGNPDIIDQLQAVAPTYAVRGNVDTQNWAKALPLFETVEIGAQKFAVIHEIAQFAPDPARTLAAVIYGHSHQPLIETKDGLLYINPGSAGPRRFRLPVSVGRATVRGDSIEAEIVPLNVS